MFFNDNSHNQERILKLMMLLISAQEVLICYLLKSSEIKQTKINHMEVIEEKFVALGHQLNCRFLCLVLPPSSVQNLVIFRLVYSTFSQISVWQNRIFRYRFHTHSSLLLYFFISHLRKASKSLLLTHIQ